MQILNENGVISSVIVRKDSGVKTLKDLEGKPFVAGFMASVCEKDVMEMLDILGIKPNYVRASIDDSIRFIPDNAQGV